MNFFILGDSWGVGEWRQDNGILFANPNTGLDFYLTQLGHTVKNVSAGSASNFGQLRHAYWTLKETGYNYDYIIWFHTEPIRDIEQIIIQDPHDGNIYYPDFDISNFNNALRYVNKQNYQYAQTMFDEFKIPFILIGGQTPIDPQIDQYTFAKYKIDNWLAELAGINFQIPYSTVGSLNKIKRILDYYNISFKKFVLNNFDEVNKITLIEDILKTHKNFPDGGHPSRHCFLELANYIVELIQC